MKAQIAISLLLMAYSIPGAFAQNALFKVDDLPKRDDPNLEHYYRSQPKVYVDLRGPRVKVLSDSQPQGDLIIGVPPDTPRQPGKTVIHVPASEFEPSSANNPKIGNFEVNAPMSLHRPLNLPPGQSSRVLNPNSFLNPTKAQPKTASQPAAPATSGSNSQNSSVTTMLQYTPAESPFAARASGGDNKIVKTTVSGTVNPGFKRGDLIRGH